MQRRRKGSGSVFFNERSKKWVGRYWVTMTDGKEKRRELSGPTKRSVERAITAKVRETEGRKVHYEVTLGEWLDKWLEESARGTDHTKDNYKRAVKEAKELLGGHVLSDVTAPMIDKALLRCSTIRNGQEILKVLRIAFKEAQRERRIPDNPASLARPLKTTAKYRPTIYTAAMLQKVLSATDDTTYRTFFAFLWATGARPWSEAAPLRWDDLLRDDDGVYFHGAKTEQGREPRPIPNWLLPHLMSLGGEDNVFPGNMDQSKVAKAWKKSLELAELPHTRIYDLRDSFATLHAERGTPLAMVTALLGQSDSKTTEAHYVRIRRKEMRRHIE